MTATDLIARRALLALLSAIGASGLPARATPWVPVASPPGPPPAPLRQRLESWTHYVLQGVPRRFLFLSEEAVHAFYRLRGSEPRYARLVQQGAPEEEWRALVHALRFDPSAFTLKPAGELIGRTIPFLEFEVSRVLYRRPHARPWDARDRLLNFALGPGLATNEAYRQAWESHLGREVLLLSKGPQSARDFTYLPTDYPVHQLVTGNHMMDQMPVPLGGLKTISALAQQLGFTPVEKP